MQTLLTRYWFITNIQYNFGLTAYSIEDARKLIDEANKTFRFKFEIIEIIENIDISTLDENHILPNIGAPNFRGVWYPKMNL
ncbi:MAG: hypothetical protein H0W77_16360 [Acidobacteria bacterium]|jgi:hypothetical protein|nr:hypothetical protein [Acidobacteriota bacterium]